MSSDYLVTGGRLFLQAFIHETGFKTVSNEESVVHIVVFPTKVSVLKSLDSKVSLQKL